MLVSSPIAPLCFLRDNLFVSFTITMSNTSRTRNIFHTSNVVTFENFFQGWLERQEHMLDELLSAQENRDRSCDEDIKDLITRVLAHYQQYYEEKSKIAQRDIFLLFAPTWFTSFEQTLFWVAGFKPALAFRLVHESVNDLTDEQRQGMATLMGETRLEEKLLNDELAKIQESVAAPPITELARNRGREIDGEIRGEEEEAMRSLRTSMETLVASADMLRTRTAARVVEILNPVQNVKFLTAATQLQLKIRRCGLQRASETIGNNI